jgi:hypothetical protein
MIPMQYSGAIHMRITQQLHDCRQIYESMKKKKIFNAFATYLNSGSS